MDYRDILSTDKQEVIFRMDRDGIAFALFPNIPSSENYVTCYEHIGQHGSADYEGCIAVSRPATEREYADLRDELTKIGYNLDIRKRRSR